LLKIIGILVNFKFSVSLYVYRIRIKLLTSKSVFVLAMTFCGELILTSLIYLLKTLNYITHCKCFLLTSCPGSLITLNVEWSFLFLYAKILPSFSFQQQFFFLILGIKFRVWNLLGWQYSNLSHTPRTLLCLILSLR
jgi:hypothetical protein